MNKRTIAIIAVVFVAALLRLLPHAPNFSPLTAMALFGGAYISNRYLAVAIPLLAMLISDAMMGFNGWAFTEQVAIVYASFGAIALIGTQMQNRKSILSVGLFTLSASFFFFLVTNFAVWAGGFVHQPALYTLDGAGLAACYAAAIPFFQNSLAGDVFYSSLLFGGFYLASINIPFLQAKQA
jgi:hypothetical protein